MKRHPLDPVSLIPALLFIGVALFALVGGEIDTDAVRYLWPVALIVVGGTMVASTLRNRSD